MFQKNSLSGRVAGGKLIGFVLGGIVYFLLPFISSEAGPYFGFGIWLLFILMGAMIGLLGIFTSHPVFGFKLNWCIRGGAVGFSFMLLAILLNYGDMQAIMTSPWFAWIGLTSPWWMLIDGTILGMFIGYITTKVSGEGPLALQ